MISTILLLTATAFLLAGILFAIRPGQVGSSAQEQLYAGGTKARGRMAGAPRRRGRASIALK